MVEPNGIGDCPLEPSAGSHSSGPDDPRIREPVAIIGMSCRFPGGEGLSGFWRLLESGGNAVTEGSQGSGTGRVSELFRDASPELAACRFGAYVDDIDQFDPAFFRISPVEAQLLDPQQRMMLEVGWHALEDAGLDPDRLSGSRTGMYAGISHIEYRGLIYESNDLSEPATGLYTLTGTPLNAVSGRVAYVLGLNGPAFAMDAACSSSLVAVHQVVTGLQQGETDLALAGGVYALIDSGAYVLRAAAGILSPDGQCKTFDASADGYVRGEGCGVIVLKRLSEAEADGDRIWGVIRGSAVNHAGAGVGLTVPNGAAQEQLMEAALSRAGVSPADVDYLEAHGTGTEVGDPIEVNAAVAVYGRERTEERPLLIGSVKTNIGHLEPAAGIAGLIKAVLAMERRTIPQHLNFRNPNPRLNWERLPVRVAAENTDWPRSPGRMPLAAVNSFGISGTNAHVVVEGYEGPDGAEIDRTLWAQGAARKVIIPLPEPVAELQPPDSGYKERPARFLPLSGKSGPALRELAQRYMTSLEEYAEEPVLADMAWTAGVGRSHFRHRAGVVFRDAASLREGLKALAGEGDGPEPQQAGKVAFVYTGQGSQWAGMGKELYETEPVVRAVLDRCEAAFRETRGASLLDVMFGNPGAEGELSDTAWEQPALYALECALTALWASIGVQPDVVLGHSGGEMAAARTAGVYSLEDGMRFAATRGTLLSATGPGAMAAIFAPAERVASEVEALNAELGGVGLSVAADNGMHQVVSGPVEKIETISERLESEEIRVRRLNTSRAFHSALVDPALDALKSFMDGVDLSAPALPFVSNVTGKLVENGEVLDSTYWRNHARQPVRFASGVRNIADMGVDLLLEIGPHSVLGPMAATAWPGPSDPPATLASLMRPPRGVAEPDAGFADAVAGAYEAGLNISFPGLFAGESRRKVSLPSYPFQRSRYWVEGAKNRRSVAGHPLLGVRHESPHGQVMFETEISPSDPAWVTDHRVHGRVVAPGALYAAMAALAQLSEEGGPVAVEEMQLHSPLILPEGGDGAENVRQLQLVLDAPELGQSRRLEIFSKGGEGVWTLHVAGIASTAPAIPDSAARVDLENLKTRLSREDVAADYRAKSASGIDLGPAFRGVQALWGGAGEALGEVALPAGVERNGIDIHPLLLDGCFQVIAASRHESVRGEAAYMPFAWERLWLARSLPERIVCHARLRDEAVDRTGDVAAAQPPETLTADLWLYAPDGTALGGLIGFTLKRATRAALLSAVEGLNDLFYEIAWRDRPLDDVVMSADFLTVPTEAAARAGNFADYLANEEVEPEEREAFLNGLEQLSQFYALNALQELGWRRAYGAPVDPEDLRSHLKIAPQHRRLLGRMLEMLSEAGMLTPAPNGGYFVSVGEEGALPSGWPPDPDGLAARLREKHPRGAIELALLERCGTSLADVLLGQADPLTLLFNDSEYSAADLYRSAPASRAANRMLSNVVAAAVSALPEGRQLRVLEVGAGTGSAMAEILPLLPAEQFDYTFTDISAGFFAEAERRFAEYGAAMEYRTLNIENSPAALGFDLHSYDLVIAANVLHATRDLGDTLAHCRELLSPSGQLIALEIMRGRSWQDLTFGLLDGWWRFADDYRTRHALASPGVWRRALADAGFADLEILGESGQDGADVAERGVIVARAPDTVTEAPGVWLLAPGSGEMADQLAAELKARNQTVVLARKAVSDGEDSPGTIRAVVEPGQRESWRSLLQGLSKDAPLKGVVHLAGLDGHGAGSSADDLAEDVTRITGSALALTQGLIDADVTPTQGVWFVTRGAWVLEKEAAGELSGSPLWGFGKVVEREMPDLTPRMIDLDPSESDLPTGLANELLRPDSENLISLRGANRRVARMVRSASQTLTGETKTGRIRDDRTYLVAGGLGGIGRVVAGWLADNGAGAIVLNGRRPPDPEAEETIAALRQGGATVQVEVADVTDGTAVREMLSRIDATLPPLGGVIHSVGAVSDGSLASQNWERFEEVMWPKILGAWHLHRATENRDLDLFFLFSSLSGIRGNPGQGNSASANTFLDQLAAHRRSLGLPGQAIQWGPWAGLGEAEEQRARLSGFLEAYGTDWMTPQQGIRALDRLAQMDTVSSAVASVDWPVFASSLPRPMPLVEELLPKATVSSSETPPSSSDLLTSLRGASVEEREGLLASFLQGELQAVLRLPSAPSPSVKFFELGMDSLMAVELRNRLNRALSGEYTASNTIVFDYPDTAALARHLAAELDKAEGAQEEPEPRFPRRRKPGRHEDGQIAIVGMACRFPGAEDPAAFWRLLEAGENAVTDGRNGSGSWSGFVGDPLAKDVLYRRGAFVEALDQFDAGFFRMTPIEARTIDPQQRMLLETSWQALEDAGIEPDSLRGSRTGVYAGIGASEYRDVTATSGAGVSYLGTGASMAVGRVAYELGLEGPAIPVELACASSLVAVHQAAAGLREGEVDLALAGGVNAALSPAMTREFAQVGMLSASGQCRAFDAAADGYVRGEGCGILVLKRLSDAEADGDHIWGVIRGSAVNQNGASAGPAMPNGPAQQRVIEDALSRAGVAPQDVEYLEAHGIGSALGDPIEVQAAATVYGRGRPSDQPLLMGSVKTNIGHLEAASGIAALIKTIMAMQKGVIPRQLNFQDPNPYLDWDRLPLRVASAATDWPVRPGRPPLAGVSALGISGTNAHLVLEGYQEADDRDGREESFIPGSRFLPLSAKSDAPLRQLAQRYLSWLGQCSQDILGIDDEDLGDMAWTAGVGRNHFDHRAGVVFCDLESLQEGLQAVAEGGRPFEPREAKGAAFRYRGVDGGCAGTAKELFESQPAARDVLERCDAAFRELTGSQLLDSAPDGEAAENAPDTGARERAGLYAVQCALTELWRGVGVQPISMSAQNGGQPAAAQAAGLVSLEEGMRHAVAGDPLPADVAEALQDATAGEHLESLKVEIGPDAGFLEAVARAYEAGLDVSFAGLFAGESRRRVSLPGYPFQRRRYWVENRSES